MLNKKKKEEDLIKKFYNEGFKEDEIIEDAIKTKDNERY